jgi:hypothetical protein
MSIARCTVCIPAWQAEAFIERTLDNAQAQTEPDIAIHVGVDLSDDRTVELCEARAAGDDRIRVLRHGERRGWANNCNALIDSVSSPFFFFYFHDDLIEPHYVERLCGLLDGRPDAASAHGDVQHFGATSHLARSLAYEGAVVERLFRFVAASEKSPLLRSMSRTAMMRAAGARIPSTRGRGLGAHFDYVWRFLSLGPALHAPETLYHRWNQRQGGLTESWRNVSLEDMLAALSDNAAGLLGQADRLPVGQDDRLLCRYAAQLFVMTRLRVAELERGIAEPMRPDRIAPAFSFDLPPRELAAASPGLQRSAFVAFGQLRYFEADQCERRRDFEGAMRRFAESAVSNPEAERVWTRIDNIARKAGVDPLGALGLDRDTCAALGAEERLGLLERLHRERSA